jgi:hypothetical protein
MNNMLQIKVKYCQVGFKKKKNSALFSRSTASQALVAHTCNLSYSGSRDQEDHGSKPAWANSS